MQVIIFVFCKNRKKKRKKTSGRRPFCDLPKPNFNPPDGVLEKLCNKNVK